MVCFLVATLQIADVFYEQLITGIQFNIKFNLKVNLNTFYCLQLSI